MLQPVIMNVSSKGAVVIPAKLRKAFGIKPNGKVMVIPNVKEAKLEVNAIQSDAIKSLEGFLVGKTKRSLTKILLEERKKDLEYERL